MVRLAKMESRERRKCHVNDICASAQGQKSRSSELQLTICFSAEVGNRLALIVVISPEQDQLALDHILCLEPELGWAALVGTEGPLL